ncbi:hypothetical protein [Rhodobaculum claviforme]|uniref:Uncharacterized protein n=1 Tax=Rhodobaculum claviforme TaxID=1549854 RepID=A0A934TIZ0_9RHOB|nr:hypothetical protein [Rhodobaculum claviforme]MBK5927020.1 hypothetical protein [Rhodobaculum claviforme]
MVEQPGLLDGEYPFISRRLPVPELAWIKRPASLEALQRAQTRANGVQLVSSWQPIELRCVTPRYGEAASMVFWPNDAERLQMRAPKAYRKGRA